MQKHTKKALMLSVLSLILCVSMLVGTTFAWFTDSVTTGVNVIQSGNLDIELEYSKTMADDDWDDAKDATDLLNPAARWEPGHTEVVYLRITNAGDLALKYQFLMKIESSVIGKSVLGNDIDLADYLKYDIVDVTAAFENRAAARAAVVDGKNLIGESVSGEMLPKAAPRTLALIVYMPETVGNEANYRGDAIPTINVLFDLFATQYTHESDSFNNQYDKAAPWTGDVDTHWYFDDPTATEFTIDSAAELAGLAAIVNGTATAPSTTFSLRSTPAVVQDTFEGKTVYLGADIDLRELPWTPIGRTGATTTDFTYAFRGTFDGKNHTVSNLYVANEGWAGLFGIAYKATLKNVKISNASIQSNRMAGALVGQLYGSIDNCHVDGADIMVVPNAVGDSYDNGDKVGGIVGWLGDNGNNRTLTNCSVKNAKIGAYRDVGGIAGYVASSTTVSGNAVANVQITVDQTSFFYGEKDVNAGLIYGRTGGAINDDNTNSSDEESSIEATYSKDGLTLKSGSEYEGAILYLVPADYDKTTVNVPEGVTTIGNYAFAYNSNVETVTLSSSVRDLGRGFDSSSVKKVVLNEGLKVISSRAFRSTTALEEVVISSTVTEISDNAFQKSSIKEIVIPANVKTVGETAFGASLIEKVTFEGDIAIQGYAFRGCPKLHTVVMNGYDVTFVASTLNGRNSMWFCNGESNNPNVSDIDFYVKNAVVKERVLTAMGAERNNTDVYIATENGGYYVDAQGNAHAYDAETLVAALEAGKGVTLHEDSKIDPAGMSNAYGTTGINVKNGQTIDGGGNILDIKGAGGTWDSGINTTGGLIKNITVTGSFRGIFINHNSDHSEKVVLENVIIDGTTYTISCDQGTNNGLEATNCTFNGWTSYAATLGDAKFVDCSFGEGNGYAFCRPYAPTEFVGCDFEAGYTVDPRANVVFENCTIGGVALTAGNVADLVTDIAKVTVK